MVTNYIPDKGDMVWLQFDPQTGHEQAGERPALVLSPKEYNRKTRLALFCPITSKIKGYPFEVRLPEGLEIEGVILADQIKNLDWASRSARFLCRLPDEILQDVILKFQALLDDPR